MTTENAKDVLNQFEADMFADLYKSRWDAGYAASVVPPLIECLEVSDVTVLHRSLSALFRIGPEAQTAIDAVITFVFHADPIIADLAIHTLGRISLKCPERAVPTLMHVATGPVTQKSALFSLIGFGHGALSAVSTFVEASKSHDSRIRRLALRGLKEIGADAGIAKAVASEALKDRNSEVRAAAQQILNTLPRSVGDT